MAKMKIDFKGFKEYAERLDKLGGDLKKTTEKALNESFNIITPQAKTEIKPHHLSGDTEKSLRTTPVIEWNGDRASVPVGFDIKSGGLASIFLMYGTKVHGTPRTAPDQGLYDAFFGHATKKKLKQTQEKIFYDAIKKQLTGG